MNLGSLLALFPVKKHRCEQKKGLTQSVIESNLGAGNPTDIHHRPVNYAADIHHIFNIVATGQGLDTSLHSLNDWTWNIF